jgi:hypothetical protein
MEMGKRSLKWDTVEEDQVIRIFANYFLKEGIPKPDETVWV